MKKVFALGLGILMLASCSKDDEASAIDASKLPKKWYFSTTRVLGQTIPYDDHEECGKDYLEFLSSGILKSVDIWDCVSYTDTGAWILEGNKITISFDGAAAAESGTVSKLTDTELQLTIRGDYNDDGKDETIISTFTSN
jgi:hypothetical protein